MVVELSQADWKRLTALVHSHGSVAALEDALKAATAHDPTPRDALDLADMVRVEVRHQLSMQPSGRSGGTEAFGPLLGLRFHIIQPGAVLWRGALLTTVALVLIAGAGVSPLLAVGAGVLAVIGVSNCLRTTGGVGWVIWRGALGACVLAWAMTSGWPAEITASIAASLLALCVVEPIRVQLTPSST